MFIKLRVVVIGLIPALAAAAVAAQKLPDPIRVRARLFFTDGDIPLIPRGFIDKTEVGIQIQGLDRNVDPYLLKLLFQQRGQFNFIAPVRGDDQLQGQVLTRLWIIFLSAGGFTSLPVTCTFLEITDPAC